MRIGVPSEIKADEHRVGLTPGSVREIVHHGHQVLVQSGAGDVIGLRDADYSRVGARLASSAEEVYAVSDMIVKSRNRWTRSWP